MSDVEYDFDFGLDQYFHNYQLFIKEIR
jgi:hypothetical protein